MKTLLLSMAALAVAVAPVFGEDRDEHKSKSKTPQAPPRQAPANVQRTYTPRVQQPVTPKIQTQQNKPNVNRTYTPKTYTPNTNVQNRTRNFTPRDQDAPRTVNQNQKVTNSEWAERHRSRIDPNVVRNLTPKTTTTTTTTNADTTERNRNWNNNNNNSTNRNWSNNNNNTNRNWSNNNSNRNSWNKNNQNRNWNNPNKTNFTWEQARRHHHREHHNRSWWRSHYSRIALFAGGYYYWNSGYWYPAYGYDPYYTNYTYDEPIYGYNDLDPGQVIANVQSALQEQGYYNDQVDGLIGPNTRAALRNFQADRGLPVTAAIDGPTLEALGLN